MNIKIIVGLILFVLTLCPAKVNAQELSTRQKQWIDRYTKLYIGSNPLWPATMKALMKVESDNCREKVGEQDPSFGCPQMKVEAVRTAAKFWKIPIPTGDDKIIWLLLKDDKFAIRLSVAYMAYLNKKFNEWNLSVIAYNAGEGNILMMLKRGEKLPVEYLEKIKENMGK